MIATNVSRGMTVHTETGEQTGQIVEVWADTGSHGVLPMSRHLIADYGPVRGNGDLFSTSTGMLQVRLSRRDAQGIRTVYVALADVLAVEDGRVILRSAIEEMVSLDTRAVAAAQRAA